MFHNTPYRNPTPDEVLATLRDEYRYALAFDPEASDGYDLTFESSIDDWRSACDLKQWRGLARALNKQYSMDVSMSKWKAALRPASVQNLRAVCELVSEHGSVPEVTPILVWGKECNSAGAFRALIEFLKRRGVNVRGIRPSTLIAPFLSAHSSALTEAVRILAPGQVALPSFRHRRTNQILAWFGISLIVASLAIYMIQVLRHRTTGWTSIMSWSGFILLLSSIAANYIYPAEANWGSIRTFGDLSRAIAASGRVSA